MDHRSSIAFPCFFYTPQLLYKTQEIGPLLVDLSFNVALACIVTALHTCKEINPLFCNPIRAFHLFHSTYSNPNVFDTPEEESFPSFARMTSPSLHLSSA
jgi:hypothetical protein